MKESVILTFGRQLKTSLQHVHQKGYGHNDVKATNIFISAAGECILGDFGSALELGKHSHEHTPTHWPVEFEDPDGQVARCYAGTCFQKFVTDSLQRLRGLPESELPWELKDLKINLQQGFVATGMGDLQKGLLTVDAAKKRKAEHVVQK
ncbi:TPA: PR domain zinc finger protein 1 [Trebouxia sp. C0006]